MQGLCFWQVVGTPALLLKRWAMKPQLRPKKRIVLVNRGGSTLYSGMIPALIAGIETKEGATIDLRQLCDRAGGLRASGDLWPGFTRPTTGLANQPALAYDLLSLDVRAVSRRSNETGVPIKLEPTRHS